MVERGRGGAEVDAAPQRTTRQQRKGERHRISGFRWLHRSTQAEMSISNTTPLISQVPLRSWCINNAGSDVDVQVRGCTRQRVELVVHSCGWRETIS